MTQLGKYSFGQEVFGLDQEDFGLDQEDVGLDQEDSVLDQEDFLLNQEDFGFEQEIPGSNYTSISIHPHLSKPSKDCVNGIHGYAVDVKYKHILGQLLFCLAWSKFKMK